EERDDLNARITYGLLLFETEQYKNAEKEFKAILTEYPKSDKVRYYLGITLEKRKRISEAVEAFARVPVDSEHYYQAMNHLTFHLKKTDPKKALSYIEKGL